MKYLVKGIEPGENNEVDVPVGVNIIGVMYHPVSFKLLVVALMPVHEEKKDSKNEGDEGEAETLRGKLGKAKPGEKSSDS